MCIERRSSRQSGVSLVELIAFIVIVSVGVAGLVSVMNPAVRYSADPMVAKQFVAIAESFLNEVLHQPYTWCDLDDANAAAAQAYTGANGCASNPQNSSGPTPSTETRSTFDNVRDYGGFAMDNVSDPVGGSVINGYRAEVEVAEAGASFGVAADAALAVTVTVCRTVSPSASCAGRESFSLTGYRFRYAPRY